jgi:hypothetical protein
MKFCKEKLRKLEQAFKIIYREKSDLKTTERGNDFQANVMRQIRRIGPLNAKSNFSILFEQFVWRLVPVTCFLVILLATLTLQIDITPESELAAIVFNDPMGYSFVQLSGV